MTTPTTTTHRAESVPAPQAGKTTATIPLNTLESLLEKNRQTFADILPRNLQIDRFYRILLTSVNANPDLRRCEPGSVIRAAIIAAQLGLEAGGPLGYAYLVPFNNREKKITECQLIIGYQGLKELARRSGKIKHLEARVVYERDKFSHTYGDKPRLIHKPFLGPDRGAPRAVYCIAIFDDGRQTFDVMAKDEIEAVRQRSQTGRDRDDRPGGSGPWKTDAMEMWCKTVTRKTCKGLPKDDGTALAMEWERRQESEEDAADLITVSPIDVPALPHPKAAIQPPQRKSEQAQRAEQAAKERDEVAAASPHPPSEQELLYTDLVEHMKTLPPDRLTAWWQEAADVILKLSGPKRSALVVMINDRLKEARLTGLTDV